MLLAVDLDVIGAAAVKFFWPAPGPRPVDHPGIPDVA
jgi:hypothetical protein